MKIWYLNEIESKFLEGSENFEDSGKKWGSKGIRLFMVTIFDYFIFYFFYWLFY